MFKKSPMLIKLQNLNLKKFSVGECLADKKSELTSY